MKSIFFMHPTLFLSLLLGVGLGVAHSFMESETEILTTAHFKKSSIIAIPTLLLLSVQNIAVLATLSTFGIYTPAVIGIGIMTSNVQASAFSDSSGLNSSPSRKSSPLDTRRRRRAHPREISAATPCTEDGGSYHVAEVLIRKLQKLGGRVTGKYPRFESPGHLPKLAALGKENQKEDESTDIESHNSFTNLNDKTPFPKSDLKIRQIENALQTKAVSLVSRDVETRQTGNKLQSRLLVPRSRWQDFIHLCWGLGTHMTLSQNIVAANDTTWMGITV